MFALRTAFVLFSAFSIESVAHAYSLSHDYYSRYRPAYGGNVYVSQQVQYGRTSADVKVKSDVSNIEAENIASKKDFSGYVLQSAVGLEHFRFLHTGVYYSNAQESNVKGQFGELKGHEAGGEVKIVLKSPVANVVLGGGMFYANKSLIEGAHRIHLTGEGYKASVELSYFTSSNVSLVVSGIQVIESLHDKSKEQRVSSLSVKSTRAGAGINIWL